MLYGIDIANYQASLVPSKMSTTDFIIVKATGGTGYKNECFKGHADATIKAGKLLGCYHFAKDGYAATTAVKEADAFIEAVKNYVGKATFWLDYEADALAAYDVAWCKAWLDRVKSKTGITAGIYMSKGECRVNDWSSVVNAGYPLWVAQYANYETMGYEPDPWTDPYGCGAWKSPTIFQYTSMGSVKGYSGRLDLDIFYGTKSDWQKLAGIKATPTPTAKVIERNVVAADTHKRMCEDERFGYSWEERYGAASERWTVDGVSFDIGVGDYDCSSSTITAWQKALTGTKYEHMLDGATYTGNMRSIFVNSGLFEWKPISFIASPGDLYLNQANHVAMCQRQEPDELSEFSWGDNGAYGNRRGDQSGRESAINAYYDYPWDGILHYNGKADTEEAVSSPEKPAEAQKPATDTTTAKKPVKYRCSTDKKGKKWLSLYSNIERDGYSGQMNVSMRWLAIDGVKRYRVCTEESGWLPWIYKCDITDLENGCAGDGSPIVGVQVDDASCCYSVHVMNIKKWYADMKGLVDSGGSGDNFAGDLANRIDAFRAKRI